MVTLVPRRLRESTPSMPAGSDCVDRVFNELEPSGLMELAPSWLGGEYIPALDVTVTDGHIVVKADIPGIDVRKLDISMTGNQLTIRGEREEEHKEESETFYSVERRFGSFSRSFTLPADVKEEGIEATYKAGVLTISIPKADSSRLKKIEVKSE